ncbi:MAG: hypothetical protein IJU23_07275, partial [Proteobacteria bacterium]|nr:hypothetical protein [Pseudomonadota bacterium]
MKRLGNRGNSCAYRGQGMSVLCLCAVAAAMGFGCNDSGNSEGPTVTPGSNGQMVFSTYVEHDPVERSFEMNSKSGCAIDSDCSAGLFCYHGVCTYQCNESTPCKEGTCSKSGRCIVDNQKSLRDNKDDANSNVVFHIPGAVVLVAPPENTYVEEGASETYVTLTAMKDYGRIDYNVQNPLNNTESELRTSEPKTDDNGSVIYSFKLDADKSSKGDDGEVERLILDTAVGSFEIALVPRKPTNGVYDGSVKANQFAGVTLPIRLAIETNPPKITNYNDIKGITIFVPSSGADLFSPEIIEDASKTKWTKFDMKPASGIDCMNLDKCWKATFSVNNYTFPKSELLSADQKVNRSIRIEINGYDESLMMFDGSMRDIMAGVYREASIENKDKKQWAKAEMDGTFVLARKAPLNPDDYAEAVDRTNDKVSEEMRDLSEGGSIACTDADIKKLMEAADGDCKSIATLTGYQGAENAQTCLMAAATDLLSSPTLVSTIIEEILSEDPQNPNPSKPFATLKDFMKDCAKADGVCAEKPEIVCAVDLLAQRYLSNEATDKAEILDKWHKLLRESYLGRQFSAWQNDVEVRRNWLQRTDEPKFLANELANINSEMLAKWETDVFASHRYVLTKQFNQNSLEVLTLIDNDNEIRMKRDLILSEFADGWSGVSDAMSLGLRRYDALYQDTQQRLN